MKKNYERLKQSMDIIMGLIFIIYFIALIFLSKLTFKYLFLVLGLGFIIYHFIKEKVKAKKKLYKVLKVFFITFLILFFIVESVIMFYPKKNIKDCDYIIVLGALVDKNKPSKTLQDRLNATLNYLKNNKSDDVYIVLSGGKGRGENISEAEAMKRYLLEKGVPEDIIIKEDKSRTTEENICFSKKLIEEHSNNKIDNVNVKIITTDFHTLRSSLIAINYGYTNYSFYSSKSKYYLAPLNYTREFYAIAYYLIKH